MPKGIPSDIKTQLDQPELGSVFYLAILTLQNQTLYMAERGNGTAGYYAEVLLDSPVVYYRLGETSGTAGVDSISAYDLFHLNTPTLGVGGLIPGDNNRAIRYNGTNECSVRDTNTAAIEGLTNITVEALVKYTSLPSSINSMVARWRYTGGFTNKIWQMYLDGSGVFKFKVADAGAEYVHSSGVTLNANQAYHLAVTVDGANIKFYVDGALRATSAYAANLKTTDNLFTTFLVVGAADNSVSDFFAGTIDDVAIYSSALDATRIGIHYQTIGQAFVVNNNGYSCKLMSITGLGDGFGQSENVVLTLINGDGFFTGLDQLQSFFGAPLQILEYVISPDGSVTGAYTKWKGTCDEIQEITQEQVQVPAFAGTPTTRIEAPRGMCTTQCRWRFAHFPTATSEITTGTLSVVNFEGYECPYQRTSTIGYYGKLVDAIDAVQTTFDIYFNGTPGANGAEFKATDIIRLGGPEIMLVTDATTPVANEQTLTVIRGYDGTTAQTHADDGVVLFNNCQKAVESCKRRGMYGNNPDDTF